MLDEKPNQKVVLVVDDNSDALAFINQALDEAGFTVLLALNGQQAIGIAQQMQPDVILLDAMMPVLDGFQTCPQLRQLLPLTPIIFMTGLTEVDDLVRAFEAGANDYLSKPIRTPELLARIKLHLLQSTYISEARKALDSAQQYVMSCNTQGQVLWATPAAQEILQQHPSLNQTLILKLGAWLTCTQQGDLDLSAYAPGLRLRLLQRVGDDEVLLKLVFEQALLSPQALAQLLSLTEREAQVLLRLAEGKSNKEIAEVLFMSPRTVNKHLEQIYPKLKVENRSAATSVTIKALYGIQD